MNRKAQIGLITLAAAGLFVGLRSLPDTECAFLHYQPAERVVDGIEFCGDETPTFLNLKKLIFPVEMELTIPGEPTAGDAVWGSVSFINVSGAVIQPHELAITHTRPLHMMVVDDSLEDYYHVHPEPLGPTGEWGFEFTPERSGTYHVFTEFVPARTGQKVMTYGTIEVAPGKPGEAVTQGLPKATLTHTPAQPTTATETSFTLQFDEPITLEPVMGALGHMVAFDESVDGYAHLHPKYTGKERNERPELAFAFNTDKPGRYRLWAQVKVDGEERFLPFDVVIN